MRDRGKPIRVGWRFSSPVSSISAKNAWDHGADLATKREKGRLAFFDSRVPVELDQKIEHF